MEKKNPQKNIITSVLEKIQKDDIKPKSKLSFLAKDYFVWFFGVFSLLVGSLAFSVLIYMERNNDWGFYKNFNDSLIEFIFVTLSYFWLIAFIVFIVVAYFNLKHTKKGYKHRVGVVIFGSLILTIILGAVFYNLGMGKIIDNSLSKRTSIYSKVINPRVKMWMQPEKGLLTGAIIYVKENKVFVLKDLRGDNWNVRYQEAVIFPGLMIVEGERINLAGDIISQKNFEAKKIIPIGPGRGFHEKMIEFNLEMDHPIFNGSNTLNRLNIIK